MKQITITLEDDGRIVVESPEMEQPYECESIEECKQFVSQMLDEEAGESPAEQAGEGTESYEAAWNQEAAARAPQPGLMA